MYNQFTKVSVTIIVAVASIVQFLYTLTTIEAPTGKVSVWHLNSVAVNAQGLNVSNIFQTVNSQFTSQLKIVTQVQPPQAEAWNVGATHTQLLVNTCVAVQTATVVATHVALHVINSQSVQLANQATGNQVAFVNVALVGVHKTGVTSVGEVPNTTNPVQVSSDNTPANSAEVVAHTFVLFNAHIAILAVQSNEVHHIVLAVCKAVAVQAFQVTVVWSPVFVPLLVQVISEVIAKVPVCAGIVFVYEVTEVFATLIVFTQVLVPFIAALSLSKVLSQVTDCTSAKTISQVQAGVAQVQSSFRKFQTLVHFGVNQCLVILKSFVVISVVVIVASDIVWSPVLVQVAIAFQFNVHNQVTLSESSIVIQLFCTHLPAQSHLINRLSHKLAAAVTSHHHAGVAHFNQVTSALSACNCCQLVHIGSLASTVLKLNKSHFVVRGVQLPLQLLAAVTLHLLSIVRFDKV